MLLEPKIFRTLEHQLLRGSAKGICADKVISKLKLQLALDFMSLEDSLMIVQKVEEYIDRIEAETTIILAKGNKPIRELKKHFPSKHTVANLKIIAGEKSITENAIKADGDVIIIHACVSNSTIGRKNEVTNRAQA